MYTYLYDGLFKSYCYLYIFYHYVCFHAEKNLYDIHRRNWRKKILREHSLPQNMSDTLEECKLLLIFSRILCWVKFFPMSFSQKCAGYPLALNLSSLPSHLQFLQHRQCTNHNRPFLLPIPRHHTQNPRGPQHLSNYALQNWNKQTKKLILWEYPLSRETNHKPQEPQRGT